MPHVFFFGYARENFDKELKIFFEELCREVAQHMPWGEGNDPRTSFRDENNLPLMDEWEPRLLGALQESAVLVCLTSPAYFHSRFCGQGYWIFDRRRRLNLPDKAPLPGVILPVIWVPLDKGLPGFMDKIQYREGEMPAQYMTRGLRYLLKFERDQFDRCAYLFDEGIRDAWRMYPALPPLPGVPSFDQVPNAFAGGVSEDAQGPHGWLPGPGVVNFIFAAARGTELALPAGRYGPNSAEWRPFLPPVAQTISHLAKAAAQKHALRYREIVVNDQLGAELDGARDRKNLILVIVDAGSLRFPEYRLVSVFDAHTWEGAALFLPWDDVPGAWDGAALPAVAASFPIRSQLKPPAFHAPIRSAEELESVLDITLTDLRAALTKVETEKKPKTDDAPAQIAGPGQTAA